MTVASRLPREKFSIALIAGNINHESYIGKNWKDLCSLVGERHLKIEQNSNDPIVGADAFLRAFEKLRPQENVSVLVDITTFTREALAVLLGVLRMVVGPKGRVSCIYNSAKQYGGGGERVWLSRGIREVRSVLGFPGDILPSNRCHLVVLFGYEVERPAGLIETFEPNLLSLGVASREHSISEVVYRAQQGFLEQMRSLYPVGNLLEFECSAKNPFDAKQSLLDHLDKYRGLNTIVAPLNTKLSVVGACLAAFERPDLQICYAQPNAYNLSDYSLPSDTLFLFELSKI